MREMRAVYIRVSYADTHGINGSRFRYVRKWISFVVFTIHDYYLHNFDGNLMHMLTSLGKRNVELVTNMTWVFLRLLENEGNIMCHMTCDGTNFKRLYAYSCNSEV